MDYITPLPDYVRNRVTYRYILTVVYRLTKIRHFIPVSSLSTESLADAFVERVYALYGTPDNIVSNHSTQFVS